MESLMLELTVLRWLVAVMLLAITGLTAWGCVLDTRCTEWKRYAKRLEK